MLGLNYAVCYQPNTEIVSWFVLENVLDFSAVKSFRLRVKGKCRTREKGNEFHQKLLVICNCAVVGIVETTHFPYVQVGALTARSPLPSVTDRRICAVIALLSC